MDFAAYISELRIRVGSPSANAVSDELLRRYFNSALQRLAGEIGWLIPTDPIVVSLDRNVYSYPLPDTVMQVLWVTYGANPMQQVVPDSVFRWIRDNQNWMDSTPGTSPSSFGIYGRNLLLNPPPAQPTTGPESVLRLGYIAYSPGLGARGVPGLPDGEAWTAIYDAALEFCSYNPGNDDAERAKRAALVPINTAFYQRHLKQSQANWEEQALFQSTTLSVGYRRTFAAR